MAKRPTMAGAQSRRRPRCKDSQPADSKPSNLAQQMKSLVVNHAREAKQAESAAKEESPVNDSSHWRWASRKGKQQHEPQRQVSWHDWTSGPTSSNESWNWAAPASQTRNTKRRWARWQEQDWQQHSWMLRPDDWQHLDGTPAQVATSVEALAAFLDSDEDDNWVVQVQSQEDIL